MKKKLQIRKRGSAPVRQWVGGLASPGQKEPPGLMDGGSPTPPLFRLTIPRHLPSWNELYEGVHWATRKKLVDLWRELVIAAWLTQKNRIIPREAYPVHMVVRSYFTGRRFDCSNLCVKVAEDALIKRVIPNDSPRFVSRLTVESLKGDTDETVIEMYRAQPPEATE